MSIFIPVGIVLLAMLTQALMQLSPGIFSIFYHSGIAKKSLKKTDDHALFFIIGTEIFTATLFLSVFVIMSSLYSNLQFFDGIFTWIVAGLLFAESIAVILFYYRRGKTTALFISRKLASNLRSRAESAKSRTDAITLGIVSSILELPFTFPLFLVSSLAMNTVADFPSGIAIVLYIASAILPLFIVRVLFRSGLNLAEIQRLRAKNKLFFRFTIAMCFLLLAALTITLGVAR